MNAKLHSILDGIYSAASYFGSVIVWLLLGYIRQRLRRSAVESFQVSETLTKEGNKMEKQIGISKEAHIDVKLVQGKVVLEVQYDGVQADANLSVDVSVDLLLDKLAEKIPGQVDDAVIAIMKAALKAL